MPGTMRCKLKGGPHHGQDGEVVVRSGHPPVTLHFAMPGGGVTYVDPQLTPAGPSGGKPGWVYSYSPELSPSHQLFVEADRQALLETARQRGVTVAQLLVEAEAKRKAAKGAPHPAEALFQEAAHRGCTVEQLLQQLEAELQEAPA